MWHQAVRGKAGLPNLGGWGALCMGMEWFKVGCDVEESGRGEKVGVAHF